MKKSKIFLLIITLLMAILLSSCGKADISDAFSKKHTPDDAINAESISKLDGMENFIIVPSVSGDLAFFHTSTSSGPASYTVVNISTGAVLYSKSTSKNVEVMLHTVNSDGKDISFFKVDEWGENASSAIYNSKGEKLLTYNDGTTPLYVTADILYIEGKCYRITKDENISYEFDYPSFSKFPTSLQKYDGYYYDITSDSVTVYNDELEFVSKYTVPSYAEGKTLSILENGNILVQYTCKVDASSKDYDIIDGSDKLELVTQIFKVRSGSLKTVRCNYVFRYLINSLADTESFEESGLKAKKMPVFGEAYKIEGKKINEESLLVKVSSRGKVTEFDKINGENVKNAYIIDAKRYIITTDSHIYLSNHRGKILGEISNANIYGKYIVNEDTYEIYSSDLDLILDYGDDNYSIYGKLGENIILYSHNANQDDKIFTGSTDLTVYRNSTAGAVVKLTGKGFYIHQPNPIANTFKVCDTYGHVLSTLDDVKSVSLVAETDEAALICVNDLSNNRSFYTIKYN